MMVESTLPSEGQKAAVGSNATELVIGISGWPNPQTLGERVAVLRRAGMNLTVVCAGSEPGTFERGDVPHVIYPDLRPGDSSSAWEEAAFGQRSALAVAADRGASACLIVHRDLNALDDETVRRFTAPVLDGGADLVMPVYPESRYDALLNRSILAPFSRALYGRRVRTALPPDFCVGAKLFSALIADGAARERTDMTLLWPANMAAMSGAKINEAVMPHQHPPLSETLELRTVLAELAGSLFHQAEAYAANWQRVRGSRVVTAYGRAPDTLPNTPPGLEETRNLFDSFATGVHNLEEIWRLVMPPATMLELKRLARLDLEEFSMPDAVWARIVYDFALAHRMRRVNLFHLLGALTPLYLGWVASWALAVRDLDHDGVAQREEQVAKAYEGQKPYFVGRWRWPDR